MKTKASMSPSNRVASCAIVCVAVGLLMQGCATPQVDTTTFSQHPPVNVNVVASSAACPPTWTCWTSGDWTIQLSEEPINTANDGTDLEIHWILIAPGWKFDHKGIDFRGHGPFHESPVGTNGTEYKVTSHKDGRIYKYAINLKGPSDVLLTWDPTVMN